METLRVVEAGIGIVGSNGFQYEYDSACSTPYVSAPSSPGRFSGGGFFFSAPASPVRACRFEKSNVLSCDLQAGGKMEEEGENSVVSPGGSDFEFSARFTEFEGGAVSADELFCNGQIRPMKVALHGEVPLWPVVDVEDNKAAPPVEEGSRGRDRGLWRENSSRHRRTRSLSPLRSAPQWATETTEPAHDEGEAKLKNDEAKNGGSVEATKQRRGGSKRWISLKDFLYRSKSEGRGHTRERLWAPLSFSLSEKHSKNSKKGEPSSSKTQDSKSKAVLGSKKVDNGGVNSSRRSFNNGAPAAGRRAPVSAHELHYTANRAQAEELKRKTYLPYRQGLLGCLGFSSKSYSTVNGLAKSLHSLS